MSTKKWYKTVSSIRGPLVIVDKVSGVSYGEICSVRVGEQEITGQVLEATTNHVVVQLFDNPQGMSRKAQVSFSSKPAQLGVSEDMLGVVFDGLGNPTSTKTYTAEKYVDMNGSAINPSARRFPKSFMQTGISTIDCMNTLVRGQKLPIFSQSGLPHNELAAEIVKNAQVKDEKFAVVFAAMGITQEEADYFLKTFRESGVMKRTAVFLNTAADPSVERIITPRAALSTAEYLAFEKDYHVLVVLTDFTNYCEALREISSARGEIPGRRGYPGYMYTDLASQYERAGLVENSNGSITQIPIISMPSGDKTHPIPDLTGYITEGQIVLDASLSQQDIYPPINPLPSLSRLMNSGIGENKTREDHSGVSDQLYASYAQAKELRELVAVVGEGSLSESDRKYLEFADEFEKQFINQPQENRDITKTLDIGWQLMKLLPKNELKKVKKEQIQRYMS